ncbi:MAG: response regulator [Deltaproteobacteria bacterium]|nr:response regulator [Deltaproteobacteria bacterium]
MPEETKQIIYLVDDDKSVRQAIEMLLISEGMEVLTFKSANDFLKFKFREKNACLITDIRMKGLSGLDLQQKLTERGSKIPIIFVTAFDTPETRNQAKRGGAVGYFRKPVDDQALLDTILWAISKKISSNR